MPSKLSRFYYATTYYNKYYYKIFKWIFNSNEYTNFTYDLTPDNKLLLAQFISHITKTELSIIFDYFNEIETDDNLKSHIIKYTTQSNQSNHADISCLYGRRIGWYTFIRILKPKIVIETGVEKGLGSLVITSALKKNTNEGFEGRYYGTDINPNAGYLFQGEYKNYGEILYGDSIESLQNFKNDIDIFINDSDHSIEYEKNEYIAIVNKLNLKSFIISDNAHCSSELSIFSKLKNRDYLFFKEEPENHWYPGGGIGVSWNSK
jgi:hypothetical protein